MKKIITLLSAIFFCTSLSAQSFYINLQGGWSTPKGDDLEKSVKGGIGCSIDFLYKFDMIQNGQLAAGLCTDGNLLFGAEATVDDNNIKDSQVRLKASKLSLKGLKVLYNFTDENVTPYAAFTFGIGTLKYAIIEKINNTDGTYSYDTGFNTNHAFACKPEIGICFKIFTIGVAWTIPTTYGNMNSKTGCTQWNIGFRIPINN